MKTKDNLLLNLLISKINIRYFYVLKSKTFILTFLIFFFWNGVYLSRNAKMLYSGEF